MNCSNVHRNVMFDKPHPYGNDSAEMESIFKKMLFLGIKLNVKICIEKSCLPTQPQLR